MMLMRRMGKGDLTVHGFRFGLPRLGGRAHQLRGEVAEAALAHIVADKVEAAYRRGDLFEKRRRLMDDWSTFCTRPAAEGGTVTPIRAAG